MSKLEVDAIEPQSGTTLTIGASGDSVNMASGAKLKVVGTGVNGIELGQQSDGTDSSRLFFTNNTNVCAIRSKSSVGGIVLSTGATIGSSSGDDRITIHSNGIMSASEGIALGVGNNDTASNVLDDYEEGSWSPAFNGTSGGASGVSFGDRFGSYVKIGKSVTVQIYINLDSWSSGPSGNLTITVLPFTSSSTSAFRSSVSISHTANFSTAAPIGGTINNSDTVIFLKKFNGTSALENMSTLVPAANANGDEEIMITATYETD